MPTIKHVHRWSPHGSPETRYEIKVDDYIVDAAVNPPDIDDHIVVSTLDLPEWYDDELVTDHIERLLKLTHDMYEI